jgi:uncharacterized protein (DUF427 family)
MTTSAGKTRGRVRVEQGAKRIRAYVGGVAVADTVRPVLVWEGPHYPVYYFPLDDVRTDLLHAEDGVFHSPSRGDAETYSLDAGGREIAAAGLRYRDSPISELRDLIRLEWAAMDAWFEEDEEVFVHPRSPTTRISILPSSRHVVVELDGVVVADSTHPTFLHETGLPMRTYLPKVDVRMDLLVATDTSTMCPYKGTASYWSVVLAPGDPVVHTDVVWSYPTPLRESAPITGLMAFYDTLVDVTIDGVRRPRPSR